MVELIILLVAITANALLGLVVYYKNRSSTTNLFFLLLTLTFGLWSAANYLSVHPALLSQLWLVRSVLFFAALLNLCVYLTFSVFPKPRLAWGRFHAVAVGLTLIVVGLVLTPLVFSHLERVNGVVTAVPGPAIALFLLQTVLLLGSAITVLARRYLASRGKERQQYKYVLFGLAGTFGFILISNLVLVIFFNVTQFLSLGGVASLLFTGSIAYAIIRHRLLDVRLIVARSVAYVLLLATLAGAYGAVVFSISQLLFRSSAVSLVQSGIYTLLAVILAITFQPLRRFFERITNSIFYRDNYDSQAVLQDFSKVMVTEMELEKLLHQALNELCCSLHIQFGQVVVFNHDRVYRIEHFGPVPQRLMVAPELRHLNKPLLVADELEESEQKRIMTDHNIRVSVLLRARGEFIGYLLLGDKLSGDIYSKQDIELLEITNKALAVAIMNAKSYAEIQEFNVTLQQRVDHATNRLRVANRHLKELDHAKDEFISMASHQLRTPLTTIKGYLSMMLEGDAGKLTIAQKDFVTYAFGSAERMVNLISDLLNVSRLSAGRFLIQTKPTDVGQMVADEVRQLATHASTKHIKLVFEPPPVNFPLVELDDNKTRQVIMNFIDNAIYYTQEGSVTVRLSQVAANMHLEVTDTGIGVPDESKRKLFSKFYRAENAQVVRPDGTGLGLYLARRVIEDQGGTIIFKSKEGKGSTFGFELPIKPPVKAKAQTKEHHG